MTVNPQKPDDLNNTQLSRLLGLTPRTLFRYKARGCNPLWLSLAFMAINANLHEKAEFQAMLPPSARKDRNAKA